MPTKVNLNLPSSLWTAKDSARLASDTLASIKLRTAKGIDANGDSFAGYSEEPIYISKQGARLAPKGGSPTPSGKTVFYEGGYKQYKHDSRKRSKLAGTAEVDLVLSGNMMNNLVIKKATAEGFTIGLTKNAQYGYAVNQDREFLGLSSSDIDIIVKSVKLELDKKSK